jgi:hypothetical protein
VTQSKGCRPPRRSNDIRRLGVNALSTQLVQVNSDSLIVAIGLVINYQFKRSATGMQNQLLSVLNEINTSSTCV